MGSRGKKIFKVVTVIVAVTIVIVAVWIMATGRGLSDQYDFGAGAYYYADIPGFEKIVRDDLYKARLPYIIYVILFLLWGWLMYRLWKHLDK
mgnify:CR=1 FL=1